MTLHAWDHAFAPGLLIVNVIIVHAIAQMVTPTFVTIWACITATVAMLLMMFNLVVGCSRPIAIILNSAIHIWIF